MGNLSLYSLIRRRQRRQSAVTRSLRRRSGRFALGGAAFVMLAWVAAVLLLGTAYVGLTADLPAVERIPALLNPVDGPLLQPTRVYDRSGQILLMSLENAGYQRRYLSIDPLQADHISPELLRVSIALLEPNFWQSPGLAWRSITAPDAQTIAERLTLDLLLWQEPAGLRRSLRMRLLAAQLVHTYGRAQVLAWYLNSAYFGHLAYGVESAARLYLGQPASRVDLAGAALLMAVQRAPALNPLDAPDAARQRQAAALNELLAAGAISADEQARALRDPLIFAAPIAQSAQPAEAFARLALDQLSARFGRQRVERGGLRVITSLDYNLQTELSCLVKTQLRRLSGTGDASEETPRLPGGAPCQAARLLPSLTAEQRLSAGDQSTASAVILDPVSGEVLALLGDTSLKAEGPWLSPHPPGSLLTPVVAVTAFARGFGPASLVWDIPTSLPEALSEYQEASSDYRGPLRLRQALANDYLTPIAQLLTQLGAQNVWRLGGALGLSSLADQSSAALLYNQGQVSPLEIAQMYGILASQGVRSGELTGGEIRPALTMYVEDVTSGEVLLDARQPATRVVLSETLAYMIHNVLSDSLARRPSLGYPNLFEIGRPAGAKMGQVFDAQNSTLGSQMWTAGYTRQRVAVFWLGTVHTSGQAGSPGTAVAGLWHAAMQYMQRSLPVEDWPEPPGLEQVEVCDPSGLLPTRDCPNVVSELFLLGNEPTAPDDLYRAYQINRETGLLATVFTPPASIEERTFLVAPPEARAWALAAGLPLPPQEYDAIQPPAPSADVQITSPGLYTYVRGKVAVQGTASGSAFNFYQLQAGQGLNPTEWLQAAPDGQQTVRDGLLGQWDTTPLNGLYALRLMVVHQDQSVETSIIQVTVDNRAPLVRLLYPISGQRFAAAQTKSITFQASASDNVALARVVWLVDGRVVGENVQRPYAFTWSPTAGRHTLQAKAYDAAGNQALSEEIELIIE